METGAPLWQGKNVRQVEIRPLAKNPHQRGSVSKKDRQKCYRPISPLIALILTDFTERIGRDFIHLVSEYALLSNLFKISSISGSYLPAGNQPKDLATSSQSDDFYPASITY